MYILPAKDLWYIIGQPVDPSKGLKAAEAQPGRRHKAKGGKQALVPDEGEGSGPVTKSKKKERSVQKQTDFYEDLEKLELQLDRVKTDGDDNSESDDKDVPENWKSVKYYLDNQSHTSDGEEDMTPYETDDRGLDWVSSQEEEPYDMQKPSEQDRFFKNFRETFLDIVSHQSVVRKHTLGLRDEAVIEESHQDGTFDLLNRALRIRTTLTKLNSNCSTSTTTNTTRRRSTRRKTA